MKKIERKKTKKIKIGNVAVGGNAPIVVQSMLKTNPENFQETLNQARELKNAGCELIRIALPHEETCQILPFLRREIDRRGDQLAAEFASTPVPLIMYER